MVKHGKKYREAAQKISKGQIYNPAEAISLIKETSTARFDATVEIHMNLNIDPTKADQVIRNTLNLPHGTGKEVRIVAFVDDPKDALAAGAVKAGSDDLIEEITKGWLDFDVAVAEPGMMKSLGKIARTLGQKGLMPNPKAGTVTPDIAKAIGELKKGKVEFRNDKQGNLHNSIGKVSFTEAQLTENFETYVRGIIAARPSGAKGNFIRTVTLTTTMGPGIRVNVSSYM